MMLKYLKFGVFVIFFAIFVFVGHPAAQKVSDRLEDSAELAPAALIISEEFAYPTGQLTTVSNGNWVTNTGTGSFIPVVAGSLSRPGYASSGIGNKIQLTATTASAEDAYRSFATQTTGTVYASFLVNVLNTDLLPPNSSATGEYFAGFISSASTTAFAARVTIRQGTAPNTYQLGLRASGNAANTQVFSNVDLPVGTTALVVISYQIVAGDANDVTNMWINPAGSGSEPAPALSQVSATDLPDVGRFFLRQGSGGGFSSPNAELDGLRIATAWADIGGAIRRAPGDFNGDGRTDFSIVRPGPGGGTGNLTWWIRHNGPNTARIETFGLGSDYILPADYDGDGSDDIAIWRPQTGMTGFWILSSKTGTASFSQFGQAGDDPAVIADYTNDGADDMAIYRSSSTQGYFWILPSSGPYKNQKVAVPWGVDRDPINDRDTALLGDYNGDGYADFTIYRVEGGQYRVWTLFGSADLLNKSFRTEVFGSATAQDLFVPGDYDGDGTTDLAVTRYVGSVIRWIYKPSLGTTPVQYINWGLNATDLEVHGDYDGDGKTDLAIWRAPGVDPAPLDGYYIVRLSNGGVMYQQWGMRSDTPTIWEFK
jgi:hypothetical protein